ncbi:META domain-containing protein [Streptomyces sp. NBC_00289]|uniref:META domain-containing protein n=1 Tax=Streptomyces sp. NBC_00289 TaxID=2975703 RepID=UPI00324CCEE0
MYRYTYKERPHPSGHRRRPALTATAVAALLPLAAACGSEQAGDGGSASAEAGTSVTGVRWAVDGLTVNGRTSRAPDRAYLRIAGDGEVKGNLGCNGFASTAAFEGNRLSLGRIESTAMACEDVPMAFERNFAATLADHPLTPKVKGDRMTLTTADGDRVDLIKETAARATAPLDGTKWVVTSPAAGGRAHLTFDEKGRKVSGSLGCNKVNATATVRDGHITLGAPSTTRMMCEASLMTSEERLLRLFDSTVSYALDHDSLTLTSKNAGTVTAAADG